MPLSASSTSSNATITGYPTCGLSTTIPPQKLGQCPDAQATLDAHNKLRANWGAPPLLWSITLSNYAQSVSDTCVFQHSNGPYGENLAIGPGLTCESAFNLWAAEAKNWPPGGTPGFSDSTGHFSAAVWKSTTQVGCGIRSCSNGNFVTCSYNPPGNVLGQFNTEVGSYGEAPPCVAPPPGSGAPVPGTPAPTVPTPAPTVPTPAPTPTPFPSFPSFPGFPNPFTPVPVPAPGQPQLPGPSQPTPTPAPGSPAQRCCIFGIICFAC